MKREIRLSEKLLMGGFSFILLFMIVQDWIPLGSLNDIAAIAQDRTASEIVIITLIGAVQILILMGVVLFYMGRRYPVWIKLWLLIHPTFIFAGALMDWWIPYFFGYGAEVRVERYTLMFGNTHSFLPPMNGIVPNTLHIFFHSLLFLCIILIIYITLWNPKEKQSVETSGD
ncbi:hypothetical protein [Evansella tamaricis]|uniref:Uncharacterized protein n=1 Tax=Evansella tamaricis TaxID=2069301 RepID=A0ABS6JEW4_9BACI|nr:hypothetical protein [Evansella tamaricis]MBU9711930.1 hypothetical protein [Evansella tamaricis]